jgi:hypothetical protein
VAGKARDGANTAAATAAAGAAATPVLQHEATRAHPPASTAPAVATRDRERRPAAKEQPISSSYADPIDIPVPAVDVDAPVAVDDYAQGTGGTAAPEAVDPTLGESSTPPVTGEIPAEEPATTPPATGTPTERPPATGVPAPAPTGTTPLPPAH